jgi:hypothetical protein
MLISSGWTEEDLATYFCRDVRTIKHYLKMATWPDDVKEIIRRNPEVFSTRVVMRQFAYKRFVSNSDLKTALKSILTPKVKIKAKRADPAQKDGVDKKAIRLSLNEYLSKQKLLSNVIKDEIRKAFSELKLI